MLQARGNASTLCSSNVFTSYSHLSLSKSLGAHHSLKLNFCMFERSQLGRHNNLDYHKSFWNIFHQLQSVHAQSLTQIKKCFCLFKALKPQEWIIFGFFQTSFYSTKCAPFFLKIWKDFNINDYKSKRTWIDENYFYNPFEHICFKSVFDSKNYGLWKCGFRKKKFIYVW